MLSSLSSFKMTSTEMRSIFGVTATDILQAGLHIAFEVFNVQSWGVKINDLYGFVHVYDENFQKNMTLFT